jgi:hypothetical protein
MKGKDLELLLARAMRVDGMAIVIRRRDGEIAAAAR